MEVPESTQQGEFVPVFGAHTADKRAGAAGASAIALPLILELVPDATSIVEVGCGTGEWLAEAQRQGITDVKGIEGPWGDSDNLAIDSSRIACIDYTQPFTIDDRFDLALCMEIAEHLPPERAASFVGDLCQLAPVVAFSAAIPFQGGVGHVNEQWPDYWERHFAAAGYVMVDAARRRLWQTPGGPGYIAQNLLLAVDQNCLDSYATLAEEHGRNGGPVLALVHPDVFDGAICRAVGDPPTLRDVLRPSIRRIVRRVARR
jgi:SAM-dependent methyltransferase